MHCPRCNGLMYMMDLRDPRSQNRSVGLVCLLCGEIVDPVIVGNRRRPPQEFYQISRTRRRRSRRRVAA